jgi:Spy/CpxP family protein refolding chaperone
MKKILTSALAIVLFVGASQAQSNAPANDHHRGGKGMMKSLNLTEAQKTQFKSLHEAEKKDLEALKGSGNVTPEQRKAIHEKYRSQFDALLTPEQRDQMKKAMQERKAEGGAKGARGSEGKGGNFGKQQAFYKDQLNLSPDQETKMKGIFQDFQAKAKDIRANTSLSADQKKEQMHSLAQQLREQSKTVLTADQLKKMEDMRGKRKDRVERNS